MSHPLNFFVPPQNIKDDKVIITGEERAHILKVLRLRTGDKVNIFDNRGSRLEVVLSNVKGDYIEGTIIDRSFIPPPPVSIVIGIGIPKSHKMDILIQKGTELGVSRIVPLSAKRAVVKIEGEEENAKIARWERIACEAVKQSRGAYIPQISKIEGVESFCSRNRDVALKLILCEGSVTPLKSVLDQRTSVTEAVVMIGPEGGFDLSEITAAKEKDFIPVSIGNSVLRSETSAIAVLTIIQYLFGSFAKLPGTLNGKKDY